LKKKKKKQKKKEKREKLAKKKKRKALWITVVIHSAFGCGGTVISPHPLVICTRCHVRAMPQAYGMLVYCRGFVEKIKNIIWRKTAAIHNIFMKKTTKLNS
jgi:hypothetical protein